MSLLAVVCLLPSFTPKVHLSELKFSCYFFFFKVAGWSHHFASYEGSNVEVLSVGVLSMQFVGFVDMCVSFLLVMLQKLK